MKQLTLVTRHQFGYHTDFFYYAKYLSKMYRVKVICLDSSLPKHQMENVEVAYIAPKVKSRVLRFLYLAFSLFQESRNRDHIILVKYFLGSSLPLFFSSKRNVIMDLRSLSVNRNPFLRLLEDRITRFEIMQFRNLTIVSHSLAKKIGRQNANVVGLGGEVPERGHLRQIKNFAKLNLVYVGSLGGRDLDFVLRAISGSTRQKDIFLTIIGSFETAQGMELVRLATKLGLNQSVKFEGYLKGELLESALKDSNIGLVHVPPSPFYTCQPSTKLYEYWAYGLPVLASDYGFDEQKIPLKSGFVYDYKIESLQKLFEQILDSDNAFDYELISKLATRYSWESVVYNQLVPLLQTLED